MNIFTRKNDFLLSTWMYTILILGNKKRTHCVKWILSDSCQNVKLQRYVIFIKFWGVYFISDCCLTFTDNR